MVNFNGKLIPSNDTFLNHKNRGFKYGDALFETIRISSGKLLFWEDHYFRLMSSMRILRMEIPMEFTMEFLEQEFSKTMEVKDLSDKSCRARLTVFRNDGGKYTPITNECSFVIEVEKLDVPFYTIDDTSYEVELFKDFYVNADMLSNLKTTNKLLHTVAGVFAEENDYQNCLLLNGTKQVVEAINGNVFLVSGNTIKTPPLKDGCLDGILRKKLIEIIAKWEDYEFMEASISPFELQKADELFITNTIVGIKPITKYRKKEFGNEVAKKLLGRLNALVRLN
ncbi:aminotransferase class IV [Croceitalea sp. MTPC9]|uniref:aminotransferase class IV n=1 Tax=unclassified Croceitalea TaxID=2632280 RepID=UPI002B3D5C84|nr:aminotransferase class IV [Croceitalea sp. MTPC6]GMN15949.1 aminotransferase class IV [Croceitalea sp. MTPC9]